MVRGRRKRSAKTEKAVFTTRGRKKGRKREEEGGRGRREKRKREHCGIRKINRF
jgi:hypothetical protein